MNRFTGISVLAALLLLFAGCASYDDTAERAEFEKLRGHPARPKGDPVLPDFGTDRSGEDALPFA